MLLQYISVWDLLASFNTGPTVHFQSSPVVRAVFPTFHTPYKHYKVLSLS